MIDYDKLRKSLKHLELQYANYKTISSDQPQLIQEAIAESVIQRFETSYDSIWKALRRHLHQELGVPVVPNSPKPILRMANENSLLPSSIKRWLEYAQARIDTTHDYSGAKAADALQLMATFVDDAIALYQTLSGQPWETS